MSNQPSDTDISALVAHLGKEGLDLRVDRRALGSDVLTEAANVVYRSSSGVRMRDGHVEVQLRTPAQAIPAGWSTYQAFGTGEVAFSGTNQMLTGRWPTVRGMVDGPNAPWAWTGDHLISAPTPGDSLPQTSPADSPRLFLPRLSELVPPARATAQQGRGLGALSVDVTVGGIALLWLVTPTAVEGWQVGLTEDGVPDELLVRRFSFPTTAVSQIRALCVGGIHFVFYMDVGLVQGFRWFSSDETPTQIMLDGTGVTLFDLVAYKGNPWLATAAGTALNLLPILPTDVGPVLSYTAPFAVEEMALSYTATNHCLVWGVLNRTTGIAIHTTSDPVTGWFEDDYPDGVTTWADGIAVTVDPGGTKAWAWTGVSFPSGSAPRETRVYKMDGLWGPFVATIPDSRPASNGFMVGEVPCVWLDHPQQVQAIDNQVGWLYVGATRHDSDDAFSVGATAYHGYGLTSSRLVLPAPVALDLAGFRWAFTVSSPAFSFQAGLFTVNPGFIAPASLPSTNGSGPSVILSLDFSTSASLSQAKLGGAVYLAGGQPHGFDGARSYEAGFNGYPVVVGESISTASGLPDSLDSGDLRQYRAYLVWRNQAGELMYSDSDVYSSTQAAVTSPQAFRTLTFSFACPASELYGKAWVEVYATTGGGGVVGPAFFQIVSEGNGVYLYQNGTLTFTVVDEVSDANLSNGKRAEDPYNPTLTAPFNLAPGFWPACDSVTMAQDRLWLAGGLIAPGTLSFTKARQFGVAVEHTEAYGLLEVSSTEDPVEWVAPYQDSVLAVAGGSVYVFGGQGPDNTGLGSFSAANRVTGGVSGVKRSVISDEGIWLMSVSGCLLIGPGISVQDVSTPIAEALAAELALGDVLYAEFDSVHREVRWYMTTGTVFVLDRNLPLPRWALWRLPRVVGGSQDAQLLVTSDGRWLDVTPGVSTDAGQPIQACVSTSDLALSAGAWVRFRHFLVAGKWLPSNTQGKVTVTAHYDGADYRTYLNWFLGPDNTRPLDQWFGRAVSSTQDGLLRHRGRFNRQRGSSVRLRLVVTGAPALLSQVTVDVTQPNGLARLPAK